jgi:hypothetical protein
MLKIALSIGIVALALLLAFVWLPAASSQGQPLQSQQVAATQEVQGENMREVEVPAGSGSPQSPSEPNIGFIDSPTAVCYQPNHNQNVCYINWYYMSVSASPNYVITMTATLNTYGPVAHAQGFFQTSMYLPYNMLGDGFRVACGALGSGGNPSLGAAYAYTIRARDSAGLGSANYGTVYCPAYP